MQLRSFERHYGYTQRAYESIGTYRKDTYRNRHYRVI